ncbi:MAG: hypothetical protein AAGA02_02640 [Bacteroidota bacterium]
MKKVLLFLIFTFFTSYAFPQDDKVVPYKELQKHLPNKIAGFTATDEPGGQSMSMNGMSYSMASQGYLKGDIEMTVSIMDYQGAGTLYTAAAMAWTMNMEYEDDEKKVSGFQEGDFQGLIEVGKKYKEVNLTCGFRERYLIQIELQDSDDDDLVKKILNELGLGDLP